MFPYSDGVIPFDYSVLRRFPDVEAPELLAHDSADPLLVERALELGIPGEEIAVIGDGYGAVVLPLAARGLTGIRVHQDLETGRRALARNAAGLGLAGAFASHGLDEGLLRGARLVLLRLPRSLAELEEIADAIARGADPAVVVLAAGRVKHMSLGMNEVLARSFAEVQPQLAVRKARLIVASRPKPVPADPPFPVVTTLAVPDPLFVSAHGGAFAGERLDIGTRALLAELDGVPAGRALDLGCGTGILAVEYARRHPGVEVVATDRSEAAVRSARETVAANGLTERILVTLDDAGSELPAGSFDVVLLNPPFHLGSAVHTGAARRLFLAAARLLRPGGELWTVFNSHLDHRAQLTRIVGPTTQLRRTPKFTVTRSVRAG